MTKSESKLSLETLMEELEITEEELDLWSNYEIKGIGEFYTEWTA